METNDTIVALATPPGIGAIAFIRLSGYDAVQLFRECVAEKEKLDRAPVNEIKLYRFIDRQNDTIDEVTAIKYCAPHSFTGENTVEILCHGGSVAPERILESLVDAGARYAARGEFTRRAFLNGKTNLAKAESINQIVLSKSVVQQKSAIHSYLGGYRRFIDDWKEKIEDIITEVESAIEFGEEDNIVERDSSVIIKKKVEVLKRKVGHELSKRKAIKEIENGVFIAIVGPVNAGKSSLFNLLLGYKRSIVDSEGGTTRDFISEDRKIGDMVVRFIDTAGLRENAQRIEKKGVEKSRDFIKNSKVLLWVSAADDEIKPEEYTIKAVEDQKVLGVINKIDLADGVEKEKMFTERSIPSIKISAINSKDRIKVEKCIVGEIQTLSDSLSYDCIISNKRQEMIIKAVFNELSEIEKRSSGEEEIIAEHCRNILKKFEEYLGKVTTEEILDRIFNEFCIGK